MKIVRLVDKCYFIRLISRKEGYEKRIFRGGYDKGMIMKLLVIKEY